MFGDEILVRTLLMPPRLPRQWLARDRLDRLFSSAVEYPLTVVSASAGYGKSAALASFANRGQEPVVWLTLGEGCDDPIVFLVHLVHACRVSLSPNLGDRALTILQHGGGTQVWGRALDSLINDLVPLLKRETLLILDDYHTVDDRTDIRALIERLITVLPPLLHLVLATRRQPQLACMPTLKVRGELLEIGEQDLAFTESEMAELFESVYGRRLDSEEAPVIKEQTGGWAIALQMVWQNRQKGIDQNVVGREEDVTLATGRLALDTRQREALFGYLAREVLAGQPKNIRDFLLRSSILSELEPAACDSVLGTTGSADLLETLYRRGLFLTALGRGLYRYHPLFLEFLREHARVRVREWKALHARAAEHFRRTGSGEQVMYHLLAAGEMDRAALELEQSAPRWLESGRVVTLLDWIDELPEDVVKAHPQLLVARGDAARLLGRIDEAQDAYLQAEAIYRGNGADSAASRSGWADSLRGQALVSLDTLQPSRAETLLHHAFKLLGKDERGARGELLGLLAENRLNLGRADQARLLLKLAEQTNPALPLRPEGGVIKARMLLHLGHLSEARPRLEAMLVSEPGTVSRGHTSEAHHEVLLLLSLVYALEGESQMALYYAQEGLDAARRLGSNIFEAGARICVGHGLQLADPPDYRAANENYLQALSLADNFKAHRSKAEAYMGLALLHGFGGDVGAAEGAAREGLKIVEQSGDERTAAHLWTTLGAIAAADGAPEAYERLDQALKRFRKNKDTYGQALAHLWLSVGHHRAGELEEATRSALDAFGLAHQYGYAGLLTTGTLFGPRDRMMLVPLLLAARSPDVGGNQSWADAAQLLNTRFPEIATDGTTQLYHPGVTLGVRTFGRMRVWRGNVEIGPHEWQRKKAQQMLAVLITNRDRWLLREQICDLLWPDETAAEAEAQFKVTLNGLNAALEPLRPPRTPPYYIRRQGGAYRFCPPEGVRLDVVEFERYIASARASSTAVLGTSSDVTGEDSTLDARYSALTAAVELHQGEYLADWLYEDWARDERERLEALYKEAATNLAGVLAARNELPEAIRLCEAILARDPGWEEAYCVLMRAYALRGQRVMALATYERCVRNLRECLDVEPLPSTVRIYEQVKE